MTSRSKSIRIRALFLYFTSLEFLTVFPTAIMTGSWWRRTLKCNPKPSHNSNFLKFSISRKLDQNCGRDSATVARGAHSRYDVIKYANELNHKRAQLDHAGTHLGKFGWNRPSSFAKRLCTDRQTDTQTDRQTPPVFRTRTITIHSVNENDWM